MSDAHESALEVRVSRQLRAAGVPAPARQVPLYDTAGTFLGRVDFVWKAQRLVLEADGWRFHGHRRHWERDAERRNRLTAAGYQVLTVTWQALEEGGWLDALKHALAAA